MAPTHAWYILSASAHSISSQGAVTTVIGGSEGFLDEPRNDLRGVDALGSGLPNNCWETPVLVPNKCFADPAPYSGTFLHSSIVQKHCG